MRRGLTRRFLHIARRLEAHEPVPHHVVRHAAVRASWLARGGHATRRNDRMLGPLWHRGARPPDRAALCATHLEPRRARCRGAPRDHLLAGAGDVRLLDPGRDARRE
eukprot:7390047-Prymnesium_polylepis.1